MDDTHVGILDEDGWIMYNNDSELTLLPRGKNKTTGEYFHVYSIIKEKVTQSFNVCQSINSLQGGHNSSGVHHPP